jgi:hypothetical protein
VFERRDSCGGRRKDVLGEVSCNTVNSSVGIDDVEAIVSKEQDGVEAVEDEIVFLLSRGPEGYSACLDLCSRSDIIQASIAQIQTSFP